MKGATIYASKTGLEIKAVTREKQKGDYKEKSGGIVLRFFQKEKNGKSIKFVCKPIEIHKLSRTIKAVIKKKPEKPVVVLFHKYEKTQDGKKTEVKTTLKLEYWKSKDGKKEGFAIILHQQNGGEVTINVPMDKDTFLYVSDLLHHLSMEQSWWTVTKVEEGAGKEVVEEDSPSEELEEVVEDDELDDIDDVEF